MYQTTLCMYFSWKYVVETLPRNTQRTTSASQGENSHGQQARIWIGETTAHSWETLVMTAINFKELKVRCQLNHVSKWKSQSGGQTGALHFLLTALFSSGKTFHTIRARIASCSRVPYHGSSLYYSLTSIGFQIVLHCDFF